jgi:hypothetical protein
MTSDSGTADTPAAIVFRPTNEWSRRCGNTPGPGPTCKEVEPVHGNPVTRRLPSSAARQPSPTPLSRGNA